MRRVLINNQCKVRPFELHLRTYVSLSWITSGTSQGKHDDRKYTNDVNIRDDLPRAVFSNGKFSTPWTAATDKTFSSTIRMLMERDNKRKFPVFNVDTATSISSIQCPNLQAMTSDASYTWVTNIL